MECWLDNGTKTLENSCNALRGSISSVDKSLVVFFKLDKNLEKGGNGKGNNNNININNSVGRNNKKKKI